MPFPEVQPPHLEAGRVVPLRSLPDPEAEPRQTSGITSRLLLAYVEHEGGRAALDAVLRRARLADREAELRDEDHWFAHATKIRLFEAAAEVLDDPMATRKMGAHALDLAVAERLKVVLRALGSPRLVYQNIVRANAKFNAVQRMDLLSLERRHARISFTDVGGVGIHPLDCLYNQGLLSCVPALFGHAPARVSHHECACRGAAACVYELTWDGGGSPLRMVMAHCAAGIAALAGPIALDPALLPAGVAASAAVGATGAVRAGLHVRRRWIRLREDADTQKQTAERLSESLHDLVSDLRLDEVLDKVTRNAQAAIGGTEFALLVAGEHGGYECRVSDTLPPVAAEALQRWGAGAATGLREPIVVDALAEVAALEPLAAGESPAFRSLCAAPLTFRGDTLGMLVALSGTSHSFLPRDVDRIQAYANQAAIAVANARAFETHARRASRDPLTDLRNHREFHEGVSYEIERLQRHGGAFSVVLFDLDRFKAVNDTAGHAEGDRVLRAVAEAIAESSRASDRAFRIGGDEFALILPSTTAESATVVAERARAAVAAAGRPTGAAYGIASWPRDGGTKDELLSAADRRLYAMKGRVDWQARAVAGPHDAGGEDARQYRRRLGLAHRLSTNLAPVREPLEIARESVRELEREFGFVVGIQRLDSDDMLRTVAASGSLIEAMDDAAGWEQPVGRGVSGRVVRSGEAAIVPDVSLDPDFIAPDVRVMARSELTVPIRVADRIWGVLNIESDTLNAFDADDLLLADTVAWQMGAALHRGELLAGVEGSFMATLGCLCDVLETKDSYTATHSGDVADLAEQVAARLGCGPDEARNIRYGALLHDIGKVGVPTEILRKPGPLTDDEFEQVKQHAEIGARLLERVPFFERVHPLVRHAHERWDGGGYPDGIAGADIPLGARVISACDAFHAMTSDRPYRSAAPARVAIEEMHRNAGTQFDPRVVEALLAELAEPSARNEVSGAA